MFGAVLRSLASFVNAQGVIQLGHPDEKVAAQWRQVRPIVIFLVKRIAYDILSGPRGITCAALLNIPFAVSALLGQMEFLGVTFIDRLVDLIVFMAIDVFLFALKIFMSSPYASGIASMRYVRACNSSLRPKPQQGSSSTSPSVRMLRLYELNVECTVQTMIYLGGLLGFFFLWLVGSLWGDLIAHEFFYPHGHWSFLYVAVLLKCSLYQNAVAQYVSLKWERSCFRPVLGNMFATRNRDALILTFSLLMFHFPQYYPIIYLQGWKFKDEGDGVFSNAN